MSDIDVTDVLLGSDIAGIVFDVVRRKEVVNDYGESTVVETTFPNIVGSVVPLGKNSLLRAEAMDSQEKTIRVVTPFRLRGASKDQAGDTWKPDVVVWNNDRFIVVTVDDYTAYGVGMVEAECSSMDFLGDPPKE